MNCWLGRKEPGCPPEYDASYERSYTTKFLLENYYKGGTAVDRHNECHVCSQITDETIYHL